MENNEVEKQKKGQHEMMELTPAQSCRFSMTIQLTAEDEKRVEERLRSGAFHSVEEVIHHALQMQEAEESWLALHKREVGEKLERAMEEFDQGGGIPGSEARRRLKEMKASRLAEGK